MTGCYYCKKPMMTTASFRDGRMVTVCETHYFRHLDNAKAQEEMDNAERLARAANEEANHHAWESFVLRNIADKHMDAYHKARKKLK